jgi:hypothetical protein
MKIIEQSLEETNAYSLFVYAIRSQVTRKEGYQQQRQMFMPVKQMITNPLLHLKHRSHYWIG